MRSRRRCRGSRAGTIRPAAVQGPTLFVRGEHSDYIRPEYWPLIEALFPRARLATVPNAGHWIHAENPNGFLAVIEAFLATLAT